MMLPLYIDPGTGSMLFSLFIGIATAAIFGIRALFLKLKFLMSGGKADVKSDSSNIKYVIFSDHKRYWNVFKSICDEFEKRGEDLVYYTASEDDPVLKTEYKHIKSEYLGEGNKPYARLNFLHADTVIATTPGLDVYQWKRSKYVKKYVHIPHTVDDLSGYRMFGLDYYDVVLTTGDNQQKFIRKIEELRPAIKAKELVNVGSTTLDNLKEKLEKTGRASANEKPVVLIAPSWGKSGILSRYGEKLLESLIKTDYRIIVRPHPQTIVSEQAVLEPLQKKFTEIEWNTDNDNFEVLNKADILITDFSGIIFDYSLVFDKPLIYADTSFDTLPYDADWLEDRMWSLKAVEKLGIELKESDFDRISNIIESALESKDLQKARDEVRSECWSYAGKSAVNIVDWLIKNE